MAIDTIVDDLDARRLHKTTDFLTVLDQDEGERPEVGLLAESAPSPRLG
jgi:hypothetical protein